VAEIGCVDCKQKLAANLNKHLEPFRAKRAELEKDPDMVREILLDGAKRARVIASETMEEVRAAIGFFRS
jgi:tryptophanyl-tRNA synthetase